MGIEKTEKVWIDGGFVAWDEARVSILTHTLHYGLGVFEGIRCYRCDDGRSAVFRLPEHIARLFRSAHIVELEIPFAPDDLVRVVCETLRANRLAEGYIRPLVFLGEGAMGCCQPTTPCTPRSSCGPGEPIWATRGSSAESAPRSRRTLGTIPTSR